MPALVQTHANNIIDASLGTAVFTATATPLKVRLITTTTPSTATTQGSEVSGGSYAPQTVTFAAAAAGSAASNITLNFTGMPAITVGGVELWDNTPARKWYGTLTANKTTNAGDTFQIASGSLTAAIA